MARYSCPQCRRGFSSVGKMLTHTQEVHASEAPYAESRSNPIVPARSMPSPEPGPVARGRAAQTGFETESAPSRYSPRPSTGSGSPRPGPLSSGPARPGGSPGGAEEGEEEVQNPKMGTLIAVLVIVAIVILNILGGGE